MAVRQRIESNEFITSAPEEREAIREIQQALAGAADEELRLRGDAGREVVLSRSLRRVLERASTALARDEAVSVLALHQQLTTTEAAELLGVSRPYVVQLLDSGRIPSHKTGTHRRVMLADLLAFRREFTADRERALDDLLAASQELEIYE